ncbi:MAG: hypothetical protein ABR961_16090 [Thermoanaerobaculaceae bacterium]
MRRTTRLLVLTLVAAVAVAGLVFVLHYVPFYAPSFLAWTGITAALAGFASLARPLRFLGIRTRVHALALALCGVALAGTAVLWPAPVSRSARPHRYQVSPSHHLGTCARHRCPVRT